MRTGNEALPLDDAMPPIINNEGAAGSSDDELLNENGPHLFDLIPPLAYPPLPLHEVPSTDSDEFVSPHSPGFTDDEEEYEYANAPFGGDGSWTPPFMLDPILDVISRLEFEQYGGDDEDDDEENEFGHFPFPIFNTVPPSGAGLMMPDPTQLPHIWEIENEEPPPGINHSDNDDGQWETSSEEVVIGGDEENLGKEVCHLSDTEDPNSLNDVAAAD